MQRYYGTIEVYYAVPSDILWVWFNANESAEEVTDQLDGLDGEVLHNQVIEEHRNHLHLQHLLSISHTVAAKRNQLIGRAR